MNRGHYLMVCCKGVALVAVFCTTACNKPSGSDPTPASPAKSSAPPNIPSSAHSPEDVYKRLLDSTTFIFVNMRQSDGTRGKGNGSGCLIDQDKRLILTNEHVIADAKDVVVFFPERNEDGQPITTTSHYTKAKERLGLIGKVVARSEAMDLALIQVPRLPETARPIPMATTSPTPGQNVFSIGTAGANLANPDQGSLWRFTPGQVRLVRPFQAIADGRRRNTQVVETNSPTNHGDSGGPMVNDRLQLVAIVSACTKDDRLVSFNIDIGEVRKFLQRYADGTTQDEAGAAVVERGNPDVPAKSGAKPGYAMGRVLLENGQPITVAGAKLTVLIHGSGPAIGVDYLPRVRPDGSYQQKLAEGVYHFGGATIQVPFNGKTYALALVPVGDDRSDRESDDGIVQDYVWKLTGPRSNASENNWTGWYGASVNMQSVSYRDDLRKPVPPPPKGTKCIFTLTPKGKLIDGSLGKTRSFTREYAPGRIELTNSYLPDIAIGLYTLTGEEVLPDGTKKPLLIRREYAKYAESAEVQFEPGSSIGPWPKNMAFTRQLD